VAALVRFRQARTTVNPMDPSKASCLVTDGVFRVSRNPMYLALLLLQQYGVAAAIAEGAACLPAEVVTRAT
jgi:protein-S-isoprenylcysteine O-methyltransferase Ste14